MTSLICSVGLYLVDFRSFAFKAAEVALSVSVVLRMSFMAFSSASCLIPFAGIMSLTVILPVVRVPVLSSAIQSTRARVSIEYKSCTSTFFLARRIVDSASTDEVSKINPSGIILIKAATVDVIATSGLVSGTRKRAQSNNAPIGISAKEIYLTMLFMMVKSTDLSDLIECANDSSLLI